MNIYDLSELCKDFLWLQLHPTRAKLAEAIRNHCRDLLILSATPHQGDHFRFWMLTHLLDENLFENESDMLENRYRLNSIVIRRTKADACTPDGSPLFARRVVHTETFELNVGESKFYAALLEYLQDGYNLAEQHGQKGRALGFVMTTFQKIAASSFAAVRATLQRRLLMLTIFQAVECDELMDVDGRDSALSEARELIKVIYSLNDDPVGRAQVDQVIAESKVQILKRRRETTDFVSTAEIYNSSEQDIAAGEETVANLVSVALPEERRKIRSLLACFPTEVETKASTLVKALKQLWEINPEEKIVIFATYLGSVTAIQNAINAQFPNKGVAVLKGGDHGAKTAAMKRFRRKDGPKILISTAAGREGINLQFAKVLFNYDLPWNPMDLEQRIGRIHRYGQKDTAQVYNLVAVDTIEGAIYLLLEEKLQSIAKTLGKLDEQGQVTEDLRAQILGQLGSRLSYDHLYQEAVRDPSLKRTRQELEVAMSNADLARKVVFELFQDLERFNLGDYQQMDDQGRGMRRLVSFSQRAAHLEGGRFEQQPNGLYHLELPGQATLVFTTEREIAVESDIIHLLGLEHPTLKLWFEKNSNLPASQRAIYLKNKETSQLRGILTFWHVTIQSSNGKLTQKIIRLGINLAGERSIHIERLGSDLLNIPIYDRASPQIDNLQHLVNVVASEMLRRDLDHAGLLTKETSFSKTLIGLVELVA